jgi:hypothetical protein
VKTKAEQIKKTLERKRNFEHALVFSSVHGRGKVSHIVVEQDRRRIQAQLSKL